MCGGREHRYRCEVTIGSELNGTAKVHSVITYARGLPEAVAKIDGWAHANFPEEWPKISCHRSPYGSDDGALEHGAILPDDRMKAREEAEAASLAFDAALALAAEVRP